MCRVLEVSASGYYEWRGRAPSKRREENDKLTGVIRQSFAASDSTYGSRRVWRDLREWGEGTSLNRVARLMRAAGLAARGKRRRRPTAQGQPAHNSVAPNLLQREFSAAWPNQKWVADFPTCGPPKAGCT
jgi:putative transposase